MQTLYMEPAGSIADVCLSSYCAGMSQQLRIYMERCFINYGCQSVGVVAATLRGCMLVLTKLALGGSIYGWLELFLFSLCQ